MRVIVSPPVLPGTALAELKQWLGITVADDDGELADLIGAALDVCADYTGLLPLACGLEERLMADGTWQRLGTRPVRTVTGAWQLAADGTRTALGAAAWEAHVDADGAALVRMPTVISGTTFAFAGVADVLAPVIVIGLTAGLADTWDTMPDGMRHGVIRLAAHQYRAREDAKAGAVPPASVTALWRPWRRLRLA